MKRDELQKMIDQSDHNAEYMRKIGESYLRGEVLRDLVAAECWLNKAVEMEDEKESVIAMALIARNILGKDQVFSDGDYLHMKKEYETAEGEKKKELELFLSFATDKQKGL